MARQIILVECAVTSPTGVVSTLRFADRSMFPMAPTDPLRPNTIWDDRLIEPPSVKRMLFDNIETLEPGLGVGVMTLANADRALDVYQGHTWGDVQIWRWTEGTPFSTATLLGGGPSGTPSYDIQSSRPSRVRLTLFDYRIVLERPIQSIVYAGSNNDALGIYTEGEIELKGKPKPLAYGNLMNAHVPGVLVNGPKRIFQLHLGSMAAGPPDGVTPQLFDRGGDAGVPFYRDLAYTDPSVEAAYDNEFDTPAGQWALFSNRGLANVEEDLVGDLAFGFRGSGGAGPYAETPGPLLKEVLRRLGVGYDRLGASFATVVCPYVVGAWVGEPMTGRELIGFLCRSGPLMVLPDRTGVWQCLKLAPPKAVADFTIKSIDILNLEADEAAASGAAEFSVGYAKIWTTYRRNALQPDLQGTAAEARLADEFAYVTVADGGIKGRKPSSWRKLVFETALRNGGDAQSLANALKALFGSTANNVPRRQWRVTLDMTDAVLAMPLGATIALNAPEFGLNRNLLLIGEEPLRPRRDQIIWTLWG